MKQDLIILIVQKLLEVLEYFIKRMQKEDDDKEKQKDAALVKLKDMSEHNEYV